MTNTWQCKLSSLLQNPPDLAGRPLRISLIGIGNELGGDDAAGVIFIRRLQAEIPRSGTLQMIEAGAAPENFTGAARHFRPDLILLVDAADFGAEAGEIALLDWRDAAGFSASTHSLPLHVLAAYLAAELNCPVHLVGVQPLSLEFNAPLSASVDQAIQELVAEFKALLTRPG